MALGICVGARVVEGALGSGGDMDGFSGSSWQVWLILGDSGFVCGYNGDSPWPLVIVRVLGGVDGGGSGGDSCPWFLPSKSNWS
jgi:hypothetical protein